MTVDAVSPEDVRTLLRQYLPASDVQRLLDVARPSAHLVRARRGAGFTRLGGLPLLTPGEPWPCWGRRPLSLLAMLDTTALSAAVSGLGLPDGLLVNVFYDMGFDPPWADPPSSTDRRGWRVLVADRTTAELRYPPPGAATFRPRPLAVRPVITLPGWQEDVVGELAGPADELTTAATPRRLGRGFGESRRETLMSALDAHDEECWRGVRVRHQAGGWPFLMQSPVWSECAALSAEAVTPGAPGRPRSWFRPPPAGSEDWRLLLQLDRDAELGWTWGDNGCLYFVARTDALRDGDFADVWAVNQTA